MSVALKENDPGERRPPIRTGQTAIAREALTQSVARDVAAWMDPLTWTGRWFGLHNSTGIIRDVRLAGLGDFDEYTA